MDKTQHELASSLLAVTDEYLGRAYADVSSELNSNLRGSETSPDEAIKNRELLYKIVALLPKYSESGFLMNFIEVKTAADVSWLEASLVWSESSSSIFSDSIPSYVIGSDSHGRRTSLLVHGLRGGGKCGALQMTSLSSRRYHRWHPDVQPTPERQLSIDELDRLYGQNGYILWSNTSRLPMHKLSAPMRGITNETLSRYSVFEHIGGLAVALAKLSR